MKKREGKASRRFSRQGRALKRGNYKEFLKIADQARLDILDVYKDKLF